MFRSTALPRLVPDAEAPTTAMERGEKREMSGTNGGRLSNRNPSGSARPLCTAIPSAFTAKCPRAISYTVLAPVSRACSFTRERYFRKRSFGSIPSSESIGEGGETISIGPPSSTGVAR